MVGNITMMAMVILVVLVVVVVVLLRQLTMVEVVEDVKMPLVQVDKKFFFNFFLLKKRLTRSFFKKNFIKKKVDKKWSCDEDGVHISTMWLPIPRSFLYPIRKTMKFVTPKDHPKIIFKLLS